MNISQGRTEQTRARNRVKIGLAGAALIAALSACAPMGPGNIDWSRTNYNQALEQTESQQLLLNIVRERFSDPVMFLNVTAISNSTTRSASASLGTAFQRFVYSSANLGASGSISETPIIFYAPSVGEKFVKQILAQVDIKTIAMLLQSGWSIERVLLVAGDSINGIRNTTAGKTADGQPPYLEYRALVRALRDLQRDGQLIISADLPANAPGSLVLTPDSSALTLPAYQTACKLLGLTCDGRPMRLQIGVGRPAAGSGQIVLATRSLYGAFYFLSEGVDVPNSDMANGYVKTRESGGGPFDRASGDLFRVRVSANEPAGDVVKVQYRGSWYFIADTDLDTKTTFALLSIMLMLSGTDVSGVSPLVSVHG